MSWVQSMEVPQVYINSWVWLPRLFLKGTEVLFLHSSGIFVDLKISLNNLGKLNDSFFFCILPNFNRNTIILDPQFYHCLSSWGFVLPLQFKFHGSKPNFVHFLGFIHITSQSLPIIEKLIKTTLLSLLNIFFCDQNCPFLILDTSWLNFFCFSFSIFGKLIYLTFFIFLCWALCKTLLKL